MHMKQRRKRVLILEVTIELPYKRPTVVTSIRFTDLWHSITPITRNTKSCTYNVLKRYTMLDILTSRNIVNICQNVDILDALGEVRNSCFKVISAIPCINRIKE